MSSVLPLLNIVFPVMAVIGVGFFYGRWKKLDPRVLAELVLFLLAPAVVFDALARQEILWEELVKTGVISILIHIIPAAAALAVKRAAGMTNRSFVPSVMLMNSVSLPYPLALLAFGEEGLAYVVLLSIPNVFISFTLGIVAHGGGASMKEPLKMPALLRGDCGHRRGDGGDPRAQVHPALLAPDRTRHVPGGALHAGLPAPIHPGGGF